MVEKDIIKLIQGEDKKNPLTDEEIAKLINTTREYVTEFRKEKDIPNSRERKEMMLHDAIKKILSEESGISDRQLSKRLCDMGYKISRFTVAKIKDSILKTESPPKPNIDKNMPDNRADNKAEISSQSPKDKVNDFTNIIGYSGSLKSQVSQAKAAILYPPHGLNTLLLGPSGVGKSLFAQAMHNFAITSSNFGKDAPFIIFNCANYADNPQLLLSYIFGYVKGAFTGANEEKKGLIDKANEGILFLDEVHRLPNEGQEILFYLLDSGKYRRLGETENTRQANVMIIAATTEDPKSSLLLTFRRRIPMVIEFPSLSNRPINERYVLIKSFFSQEASRIKKEITVEFQIVRALLLYDCPGNIGQLRSDVQVTCARGFLNSLINSSTSVEITMDELPDHIKTGMLSIKDRDLIPDNIYNIDLIASPSNVVTQKSKNDIYFLSDEIYSNIEEKYHKLEEQKLNKDEINEIIWDEMENNLNKFASNIESKFLFPKEELKNIIDIKILNVVEKITNIAKKYFGNIKENFYYCVAVHLSSTCERLAQGKVIKNPQLDYIKKEYEKEYQVAQILTDIINKDLNIFLPEDEIGFLAMYLKTFSTTDKKASRVAVIVLSHGHVACGMVDVANKLLGVNLAVGIEMSLDESPKNALDKTIKTVAKVNEGKGCLLLVDMGSLVTFGEIITKETGIPTRVIGRTDTVMVLEAVRRSIIPYSNLDEIADALDGDKSYVGKVSETNNQVQHNKTIIAACITGEGTALKIKKYLEDILANENKNIEIVALGIMDMNKMQSEIVRISKSNNVVAIVGTINPNISSIPFISFQDILKSSGLLVLKNLLGIETTNPLLTVINDDLIRIKDNVNSKSDAIDGLCKLLESKKCVTKDFMMDIYRRELMGGTYITNGVAIPHGLPQNVLKSSIAILKLNQPILWDNENKVNIIFMLALKETDKNVILELFKTLWKKEIIKNLNNSSEIKDIKGSLLYY